MMLYLGDANLPSRPPIPARQDLDRGLDRSDRPLHRVPRTENSTRLLAASEEFGKKLDCQLATGSGHCSAGRLTTDRRREGHASEDRASRRCRSAAKVLDSTVMDSVPEISVRLGVARESDRIERTFGRG